MAVEKTDKEALAYFQVNGVFLVIIRVALRNRYSELTFKLTKRYFLFNIQEDHSVIDVKANL